MSDQSELSPQEQAELATMNADSEAWLDPSYPFDQDIAAQIALAQEDVENYCDMAMAFEGRYVYPHAIHALMHDAIRSARKSNQHCVLVLPPEHGKTSGVAKYIVWQIAQNTSLRVAMVSSAEKTAKRNLIHARKTLVSPLTKTLWPHIKPDTKRSVAGGGWSQEHLYLEDETDPTVMAYSLLSDAQGMRFDLIWMDDVISRDCRFSEPKRIDAHSAIHDLWLNRLTDNNSLCIITNNCWHPDDTIHRATQSDAFLVLWVGYDGVDEFYWRVHHPPECWPGKTSGKLPLWSEVWPRTRLVRKRNADPPAYDRLFRQQARVADDSRLPTPDTWATYRPDELPGPETGARPVAYLDPAGGRHVERGDFAAMVLGLVAWDRAMYVLDVWLKRISPMFQVAALWKAHQAMKAAGWEQGLFAARIEVLPKDEGWIRMALDAFRAEVRQLEPESSWLPVSLDYSGTAEHKYSRIESLHSPLSSGQILFPKDFREWVLRDDAKGRSWAQFTGQMEDFGSKACAHDDGPDALEGFMRLAQSVGPGLARPGTGLVGVREAAAELAEHRQAFERGAAKINLKSNKIEVIKPRRRFI